MPRTPITVKASAAAAPIVDLFAGAVAVDTVNGMEFPTTGTSELVVSNGSGVSINVTLTTPLVVDGLAVPARVVAVAAGKTAIIREAQAHKQPDGKINVDFSAAASISAVVHRRD